MIDLDRYMKFLEEHKLTQRQLLLLFCIYKKRSDLLKKYKKMFPPNDDFLIGQVEFDDLIDRGFIIEINDSGKDAGYKITELFTQIFVDKQEAVEQLIDMYPAEAIIKGIPYPLKLVDEDELKELYAKRIKESALEHLEVIKDIEYGIDNGLINMGIQKFVSSKYWLTIRAKRTDDTTKEKARSREL